MSDDTSHYEGAVLEDIDHKLTAILEGQSAMGGVPRAITRLEADMSEVKTKLAAMQAAIKDEGKAQRERIDNHEGRISSLEQATA